MTIQSEAIEHLYAALNRNDIPAAMRDLDPAIVRNEFLGSPRGAAYRGIAEVRENFFRGRGTWAEGSCDIEKLLEQGDKVVVYVRVHVRLKVSNEWVGGRIGDGFVFRDGKIVEFHSFAEPAQALEWAGIRD